MVGRERTPYEDIDVPVRNLVRVLNRFPGVETYTSCGGHENVEWSSQNEAGFWYVDSHIDRSDEGYASLEFLASIAYDLLSGPDVHFGALAKPPYLNFPGEMLFYRWSGTDPDDPDATADALAELLTEDRRQGRYVTAHQARNWPAE